MARILIADDNESLRIALRKALAAHEGWSICGEASDGVSAVSLTQQLKPDLVILDFLMPLRNGLAAAAEISKAMPGILVVLYTMHMSSQLEREAQKIGVRKVVSKTETFQSFLESLEAFLATGAKPIGPLGIGVGPEVKNSAPQTEEIAGRTQSTKDSGGEPLP